MFSRQERKEGWQELIDPATYSFEAERPVISREFLEVGECTSDEAFITSRLADLVERIPNFGVSALASKVMPLGKGQAQRLFGRAFACQDAVSPDSLFNFFAENGLNASTLHQGIAFIPSVIHVAFWRRLVLPGTCLRYEGSRFYFYLRRTRSGVRLCIGEIAHGGKFAKSVRFLVVSSLPHL